MKRVRSSVRPVKSREYCLRFPFRAKSNSAREQSTRAKLTSTCPPGKHSSTLHGELSPQLAPLLLSMAKAIFEIGVSQQGVLGAKGEEGAEQEEKGRCVVEEADPACASGRVSSQANLHESDKFRIITRYLSISPPEFAPSILLLSSPRFPLLYSRRRPPHRHQLRYRRSFRFYLYVQQQAF